MFTKNTRGKKLFWAGYLCLFLLFLEGTSRIYLTAKRHEPFFKPGNCIYSYYPGLRNVLRLAKRRNDPGSYDILLLGASTLTGLCGDIEPQLKRRLKSKTGRNVRIYNLAEVAHTSLDQYYKYRHLDGRRFDLVLFYDGINEVRANNCPPGVFADDYSHYSFYEDIDILEAHREINVTALPYALHYLGVKIWKRLCRFEYVPTHNTKAEWVRYGGDIKTKRPFEKNLTGLVEIAAQRKEKVLLASFAFYIPENYSLKKFTAKALDYRQHLFPVEIWGAPAYVKKGIEAHNEAIDEIRKRHPEVLFVDECRLIPKNGLYFDDACHFSPKGCDRFVDNLLETIASAMAA